MKCPVVFPKVFIAGSMAIKRLDAQVLERIANIVSQKFEIVVGDADGVDKSIQQHLSALGAQVKATVFCSGEAPRNNVGRWPVESVSASNGRGSRAFYTAKDLRMADVADFGLMIWDAQSVGTLSNVIELLARKKKSVVFLQNDRAFQNVGNVDQLEALIDHMAEPARRKADAKIRLTDRLRGFRQAQMGMFD